MDMDKNKGSSERTIESLLRSVTEGQETAIEVSELVNPDGTPTTRVEFGQRRLNPEAPVEPVIARAGARQHTFHSVDAYCEYLSREAEKLSSLVLADYDREQVIATLDESDGYDREKILFRPCLHPLIKPWLEIIGTAQPVLKFALFCMQYRSSIIKPEGRELALMFSQIKASKTITKKSGVGPKALNGVMIETTIGSERHEYEIELPESIQIDCPLFLDTDPITIEIDLLVTDTDQGIVVFLTAPNLAEARYQAFMQFVDKIKQGTGLCCGLGVNNERPWSLVE